MTLLPSWAMALSPAKPQYLRCEYRVDPLGIDVIIPRLSWETQDPRRGAKQAAYQIVVSSTAEKLTADQGDLWDSRKVEGDQSAQVEYRGKPLASRAKCFWKVRIWDQDGQESAWSQPALWTMGLLDPTEEFKAKWIGYEPATDPPTTRPSPMSCPLLRKQFSIDQPIRRVTLYASALGNYQIHINGTTVGKDYFTPDWTDYHKRVYYNTYDVTQLVHAGDNAIGGMLAAGWYAGALCLQHEGKHYGDFPRLAAQLEIELADGSRKTVATDDSWRTTQGPILEGEFQAGETYDATQEIEGWDQPGLDDSKWRAVCVTEKIDARLQAFPGVTVQETVQFKPVKITEPSPGKFIFDMGQNFSGVARIKVRGPRGTRIVMRFGEWLNQDGTLYNENYQGARCIDTYVLKGEGEEIWQPRFTYRGYQYVEVSGLPSKPDTDTVTGIALNSATPRTSEFECSSPMVNKLFNNICWTQLANFVSVPTDCPQRDERMGWTGDAQIYIRTASYNADVAAFFTKWLVDLDDTQLPTGEFADVAPEISKPKVFNLAHGKPGWGDAGVICPWTIYHVYKDRRQLAQHYPAMVRWVEFSRKQTRDLLMPNRGRSDWLPIGSSTPKDVFATAHFAQSTRLTALAAQALGKDDDAKKYSELFEQIKAAFNKAYVSEDGKIKGNTQACYAMALAFDLLPAEKRQLAGKRLVDDIKAHDDRLTTGFSGTALLLPMLSATGHTNVAYQLLLSEKFPSWGFMIKQGATSLWENWDGVTPEKGFQDPRANSLAHYAFGAVGQWMFQNMAGIDTDEAGFQKLLIRPEPGPGIDWIKASYHSLHGQIRSAWKRENGRLTFDITIPANSSATILLPTNSIEHLTEAGMPLSQAVGVKVVGVEHGRAKLAAEAGKYHFEMPEVSQ